MESMYKAKTKPSCLETSCSSVIKTRSICFNNYNLELAKANMF